MLQQFLTRENILFIPVFLIVISVLVAAHEYGHYLFARLFGMGVEEFAIGFGRRPLWIYKKKKYLIPVGAGEIVRDHPESSATDGYGLESKDRRIIKAVLVDTPEGQAVEETTNFTVRAWPLGGFVRIKGMLPEDDGSETKIPGGFYSKAPWKRFIVLLAGPVFSVIAGVILLFLVFAIFGQQKPDNTNLVAGVSKQSPAEKAGLRAGDKILAVDSEPVKTFFDVISKVRFAGEQPHLFTYLREGKEYTTELVPVLDSAESPVLAPDFTFTDKMAKQAKIGFEFKYHYERMPITEAAYLSIAAPARAIVMMGALLMKPAQLKDNVGGPITMLRETHNAVSKGPPDILGLAAMLSISVGIFNLFPIPPLDGGQMAIAVAEMFRGGRRLSMRVQSIAATAGALMVLLLVVVVFTIDFQRLGKPEPTFKDKVHSKSDKPAAK